MFTIQHCTDGINSIRQENETRYKVWNWWEKISLFTEDMIFYIENSCDSTLLIYQNCMCLEITLPECLKLTCEYILKGGNLL